MTIDELINKLDEAKLAENNAKVELERCPDDDPNKSAWQDNYDSAIAARKLAERNIEEFEFAEDAAKKEKAVKKEKAAKAAKIEAAAKNAASTNKALDARWRHFLRQQGRNYRPRPAGWGE